MLETYRSAVVVQRVEPGQTPDTEEIWALAEAAGYNVIEEVVQTREEDPEYNIGSGKVDEISEIVNGEDVSTIIFTNRLGPYQTYNIGLRLPRSITVIDRYRLILEIFGQRAQTRKAQLQVELAKLRYELPRAEAKASLAKRDEHPGFMGLGEYDESREKDIKSQISRIRQELIQMEATESHRRTRRRDLGFDLVALAGYTNAGKSTLLQRLSSELEVGQNNEIHPDIDPTAEVSDKWFTTLGTTTRRVDLEKRDILLTDTVGFISDLPYWLIESFRSTLDSVYRADLVLLVVDVTDPVPEMREKMFTSLDILRERQDGIVLVVLNKTDKLDNEEIKRKQEAISDVVVNPVSVSAKEGDNIDQLQEMIENHLPHLERERLQLPMIDGVMSLVSWIHDNAHVNDVFYTGESVLIDFEAKKQVVGRARAKADELYLSEDGKMQITD